jgi:2'-hydroxyisoflavone reductase
MDLLVIGGTRFLGRHLVDAALDRGDRVTIVHRGSTPSHRAGDVEEVLADRADGDRLRLLVRDRRFDAVVDTCGYHPASVRATCDAVASAVGRYVFVSTVSVYADQATPGIDEDRDLLPVPDPMPADATPELYGELKVACEQVAAEAFGDRCTIVRPGLIVGPFDPTDRFTYWALRRADPGPVLAPAIQDAPVQVIDARDLARFVLRLIDDDRPGVFNATGSEPVPFARLLDGCEVVWVPEALLLEQGVAPWAELPLWIPADSGAAALMQADVRRAVAAGLRCRPIEDSLQDTLAWARTVQTAPGDQAGTFDGSAVLPRDRERALLALVAP